MKRLKTIFFLILIISSNISLVFSATDEGYGEDSTSLGQFVDSYENSNYVSVADEVVNNATLGVMELNYTLGTTIYQNYSDFTKVGANSRLNVTDYNITTNPDFRRGTEEGYYYDLGAGNIGDFEFDFQFVITDVEAGDADHRDMGGIFAVNNWVGDFQNKPVGTYDYIVINIRNNGATDDTYTIRVIGSQNGANTMDEISAVRSINSSIFYGTINRTSGDVYFWLYDDVLRTNLILSLSDTDGGCSDAYRYLYGWHAVDAVGDASDYFVGSVAYLGNGTLSRYSLSGYYTTTNYMLDVNCNGTTLVEQVIATIPTGTATSIEFSSDNSTWTGTTALVNGFNSIELRGLNYTACFKRFNMSTTDITITPWINQSKLISTIGNSTGGGSVVSGGGLNSATILMLIFLLLLGSALYIGVKK